MDSQKRLIVAIALSMGLTLVFSNFVWKPQLEAEAAKAALLDGGQAQALALEDGGAVAPTGAVMAAAEVVDGGEALPPPPAELPLREVSFTRPTMKLAFSTEGGVVNDALLTGRREHEPQELSIPDGYRKLFGAKFDAAPQMDLAQATEPGQLSVAITGDAPFSSHTRYQVVDEADGRIVFTGRSGPWEITKTYSWDKTAEPPKDGARGSAKSPNGYLLSLDIEVKNVSAAGVKGDLFLNASRDITAGKEQSPSLFGGIGNEATVLCRVNDDLKRKRPDNDKPVQEETGNIKFVGLDQQYFLTAVWPKSGGVDGRCLLRGTGTQRVASLITPMALGAGEKVSRSYQVFLGPKDLELLLNLNEGGPGTVAPNLERTVDFGIWAFICKVLLFFLRGLYGVAGNWGVAIILLTVGVKLVLLPLTHRAMVSGEEMKKLQPRMEQIKKQFPDDRDRQNAEMMKLYQEAKVNPLGGCLPLLVQLPIWGALFTTLRTSYELYGEPFYGVWSDLTSKDPTYLLPFLLGITMVVTQRLQPQMMDAAQAKLMTWFMPIFFTAMMMNYPAGLALYIVTNNLLSILQQFLLRRYLAAKQAAAAAPSR
jgi:YidC/Oxa1 family membrane protein insertase